MVKTKTGAATQEEMEDLHGKICRAITTEVDKEKCDPKWVTMGLKLLGASRVTMVKELDAGLTALDESLQDKKKRDFSGTNITEIATGEAEAVAAEG